MRLRVQVLILAAISTSTTDSNIDINVTPLGTGNVNLLGDTVQCGDHAAATVTTNGHWRFTF